MAVRSVDSRWSWFVCFCATFCQVVNMGIAMTFGVFFPVIMEKYDSSRQTTAWIGSIAVSLIFFTGPLSGSLSDRFGCRVVAVAGGLISTTALVLTSFASEIVHYFFTYSILFGLGGSFVRVPCFLITGKYFKRRRSLAAGIVTAGAGLGVFVFGPFTQYLLDTLGLANTYRVMAIPCLAMSVAAASFYPVKETEEITNIDAKNTEDSENATGNGDSTFCQGWKVIDCSLWKIPAFTLCVLAFTFEVFGFSFPGQHLVKHCQEVGFSPDSAANLFMYIGFASFMTRITAGHLCDVVTWLKPLHLYQFSTCVVGIVTCFFAVSRSYAVFVVLSILFGLNEGVLVSMCNLILLTIVTPRRTAAAFGLANCLMSFAFASGPPLAGLMADQLGSYKEAFYTGGCFAIFASCLPLALLCFKKPGSTACPKQTEIKLETDREQEAVKMYITNV